MSATTPPTQSTTTRAFATNTAMNAARDLPDAIAKLEKVDPALAAQLTGSLATYFKAGASPVAAGVAGWLVGQAVGAAGLACSAAVTTSCWSPEFQSAASNVLALVFTAAGALVMHWWSKAPARAVVAGTVVGKP